MDEEWLHPPEDDEYSKHDAYGLAWLIMGRLGGGVGGGGYFLH